LYLTLSLSILRYILIFSFLFSTRLLYFSTFYISTFFSYVLWLKRILILYNIAHCILKRFQVKRIVRNTFDFVSDYIAKLPKTKKINTFYLENILFRFKDKKMYIMLSRGACFGETLIDFLKYSILYKVY
jgi:hypothetical protein